MAKKRMFSLDVVDTDDFLEMPCGAQALYFQLGMHGDDDGFVGSPRRIMRAAGARASDLKALIAKSDGATTLQPGNYTVDGGKEEK